MNHFRLSWLFVLAIVLAMPLVAAADTIAVSHLGYHPDQPASVVVYTHDASGTVQVHEADSLSFVKSVELAKPLNYNGEEVGCQGNLNCLVADLQPLPEGEYVVIYENRSSATFPVSASTHADSSQLYFEWFNAHMMQNSSYHATYFGFENPDFSLMADGAFLMESAQASTALARLGSAYQYNPALFAVDTYDVIEQDTGDGTEYILAHVDYLRSLQADNGRSNPYQVPLGYTRPWGEWITTHPDVERYTTETPDFIVYSYETRNADTARTAHAYMSAMQAVSDHDPARGKELLSHTLGMLDFMHDRFGMTNPETAAYAGAAYFLAYEHTGNWTYLERAYELRDVVETQFSNDYTKGNEFYWLGYIEHEQELIDLGFEYPVDGNDPVDFFRGKLFFDYKDRGGLSISDTGERVYEFDRNIQFSNSRYMLLEAVFASKLIALENGGEEMLHEIADSQLAWLTGLNAVQLEQAGNQLRSVSFISGIGGEITQIHSRITPPKVRSGEWTFSNGQSHIPGWITGAYDYTSDEDIIRNYDESHNRYWHTETTNEMVVLALELTALRDAWYNGIEPATRQVIIDQSSPWPDREPWEPVPPTEDDNSSSTCSVSLASAVATCSGGEIVSDVAGGCRSVICESASGWLDVLACDKGTHFEMYKQTQTDPSLELCLDETCISNNGYAKSNDYLACAEPVPVQNATITVSVAITNDDGGSLDESTIQTFIDGDSVETGVAYTFAPGTYTVSASDVLNYSRTFTGDCSSDGSLVAEEGQDLSCIVSYDDIGDASCVTGLEFMPVSCSGTITSDVFAGCREVVCEDGTESIQVLACDKPGTFEPTHFELYRQSATDNPPEVCFGTTCVQYAGYAKSPDYPICSSEPVCTDIDGDGFSVQGGVCGPVDCDDSNADVNPGAAEACNLVDDDCDGSVDEDNVCPLPVCGNSVVESSETCDDGNTLDGDGCSSTCQEEIDASLSLGIAPWYPQDSSYVFICEAEGFEPTRYDFFFGDGNQNPYRTTNDVYYTYASSGEYTVTCQAYEGDLMLESTLDIVVS